jgi:hypothetical protein
MVQLQMPLNDPDVLRSRMKESTERTRGLRSHPKIPRLCAQFPFPLPLTDVVLLRLEMCAVERLRFCSIIGVTPYSGLYLQLLVQKYYFCLKSRISA